MQLYIALILFGGMVFQVSCQSLWNVRDTDNDDTEDFQPDVELNGRQQEPLQRNVRQQGDFEDNPFFVADQRQFGRPSGRPPFRTTTTTTITPPTPGGDDSSTTTTASPIFTACFNACQSVQQYNPVCGTDGVTYNNEYRLRCASSCGKNVQMVRGGTCAPL